MTTTSERPSAFPLLPAFLSCPFVRAPLHFSVCVFEDFPRSPSTCHCGLHRSYLF
eukprot:NODE_13506_length_256_cov_16.425121_g12593_i0.p1 GENE.NODE_13506_length_256_cov_16.425121_g12593_i0~~NODE_13506_length_256_cov_16.425121_g12593_i0.p1  ORF type:complete len:55 (+),score=0.08 NODE_13506_length_256_cov_16.425121_g12593_i0:41-205(+)